MIETTWRTFGIVSFAVLIAVVSQLQAPHQRVLAAVGFAVAVAVFILGLHRTRGLVPAPRPDLPVAEIPLIAAADLRFGCLAAAVVFLSLAFFGFGGGSFTAHGVLPWAAGLACFGLAVWRRPARIQRRGARTRRLEAHHLALIGIMVLAVFFRFWQLDAIPPEMTSDHAEKLFDVRDVLDGERPIFFPRNTGREALQFYVTAWLIKWTPLELGHLALKVGTGIFGVLAVLFTYLLGRELYNRQIGLLAAALLAVGHWHVAITRVGLRFPFTAAFATPALYFLFRAFRHNRRRDWILVGVFLGVGLHTYIPMRIVPLLLVALCAIKLGSDLRRRGSGLAMPGTSLDPAFWVNAVIGAATSVIFFLPLLRYMIDEPEIFWSRAASRAVPEAMSAGEMLGVFLGNLADVALAFSFIGDVVAINTVPNSAVLGWLTGGLFVLGVAVLGWGALVERDLRPVYLAVTLFVLLLPSTLSIAFPVENPSVVRMGGAPPVVMMIAALPLYVWAVVAHRVGARVGPGWSRGLPAAGIVVVLAAASAYGAHWYFVRYPHSYVNIAWNTSDMGRTIRQWVERGGDLEHAHHVPFKYWADTRLIALHAGDFSWHNDLWKPERLAPQARSGEARLFLLHPGDTEHLSTLEELFPHGRARIEPSSYPGRNREYVVFEVPPGMPVTPEAWTPLPPDGPPKG